MSQVSPESTVQALHIARSVARSAVVMALVFAACACSKSSQAPSEATEIRTAQNRPPTTCTARDHRGHESPDTAFERYAKAVNDGDWCQAIKAYAPNSRVQVALENFRLLVVLAGSASERRTEYRAAFERIATQYALGYTEEHDFATLYLSVINRTEDLPQQLAAARRAADGQPEQFFVDLLRELQAASGDSLVGFETGLVGLETDDKRAAARAKQTSGRLQSFQFVRTPQGWMLAGES